MVNIINPQVEVVDYGPKIVDKTGKVIVTPDELVYAAAGITFNDAGFFDQTRKVLGESDITQKIMDSLIASVGAGHASLATTPGLWIALKGNCSKLVDSMFTGVRYGSSLMPSGRRIPVAKDQIVVPRGIANAGEDAVNLYMRTSESNIDAYEKLMEQGVQKEEAAKIVQYGHRGGGFMFMPLETIVSMAHQFEENPNATPREGHEIIAHLEDFIRTHGMPITYFSRKNAPRTGVPNTNIFHYDNSLTDFIEQNAGGVQQHPVLVSHDYPANPERDFKIRKLLERRAKAFSTTEGVLKNWKAILQETEEIVREFNDSISAKTVANTPWRVWGEDKRHRTLDQSAESVYHATKRLVRTVEANAGYFREVITGKPEYHPELIERFEAVFSIPPAIKSNPKKLEYWLGRVIKSAETYDALVNSGIPKSDAIHVMPRGLKFGVESRWNLYNLTTGKMSLRLCNTCEPEMRRKTEQEKALIIASGVPEAVAMLMEPKCSYVGFCPEGSYDKRCCKKVGTFVPGYDKQAHETIQNARKQGILYEISRGSKSWFKGHEHFMAD